MDCEKLRTKLSAYMDGELSQQEHADIEAHLKGCAGCAAELAQLERQVSFLQRVESLPVPSDFKARFWQKVRAGEEAAAGSIWRLPVMRWIPVPAACALAIIVFSTFSMFSPLVYGVANSEVRQDMVVLAEKAFTGYAAKNLFGPVAFAEFCNGCEKMLCKCCGECTMNRSCETR